MKTSDRILSTFSVKNQHNIVLKFCTMVLPDSRYEEFMGFFMKFFVPEEVIHRAAGLMENVEAFNEYKRVLSKTFESESVLKIICCLDSDEGDFEIVGGSILQLYKKNDPCDYSVETSSEQVRVCKNITKEMDMLVPIEDLMTKYEVDRYCEILGTVVHPHVRQLGIFKKLIDASYILCHLHSVPLIGTWCTSEAAQKEAVNRGLDLIYEINNQDLSQLLGIPIEDNPPTSQFVAQKVPGRSKL